MAKQSIESMFDLMFKMRDGMEDLLQDAQELAAAAKTYGGEISRVLTEQLSKYFAPAIKKLIDDEQTPGAILGMIRFMDSVPLAYTRIEPSMDDVAPIEPEAPQLDTPAVAPEVTPQNLPLNTSFANPVPEEPVEEEVAPAETLVQEAVIRESLQEPEVKDYVVIRKSTVGSALGEEVSNPKDNIVCSFDTEEEAIDRAKILNDSLDPFEKDAFGFSYEVAEKCTQFKNDSAIEKAED